MGKDKWPGFGLFSHLPLGKDLNGFSEGDPSKRWGLEESGRA